MFLPVFLVPLEGCRAEEHPHFKLMLLPGRANNRSIFAHLPHCSRELSQSNRALHRNHPFTTGPAHFFPRWAPFKERAGRQTSDERKKKKFTARTNPRTLLLWESAPTSPGVLLSHDLQRTFFSFIIFFGGGIPYLWPLSKSFDPRFPCLARRGTDLGAASCRPSTQHACCPSSAAEPARTPTYVLPRRRTPSTQ